jgi:hypothetical protein
MQTETIYFSRAEIRSADERRIVRGSSADGHLNDLLRRCSRRRPTGSSNFVAFLIFASLKEISYIIKCIYIHRFIYNKWLTTTYRGCPVELVSARSPPPIYRVLQLEKRAAYFFKTYQKVHPSHSLISPWVQSVPPACRFVSQEPAWIHLLERSIRYEQQPVCRWAADRLPTKFEPDWNK